MAAPEAPVKYVGICKDSAAFKLMKSMVSEFSCNDVNVCRDFIKEKT